MNKKRYNVVITHNGTFHADEVLAIAMLRHANIINNLVLIDLTDDWDYSDNVPDNCTYLLRMPYVNVEKVKGKSILVLDISGYYDKKQFFDHHQDAILEASCCLILDLIDMDDNLKHHLKVKFLNTISAIDVGKSKPQPGAFSQIIAGFNYFTNGFMQAYEYAYTTWNVIVNNSKVALADEILWKDALILKSKSGLKFKSVPNPKFSNWKRNAILEGYSGIISPNERITGHWQLVSADSNIFCIPSHESQTFRHNSGFLSVYASYEDLINHLSII